jgi:cytochrome c oxidase subunit 2
MRSGLALFPEVASTMASRVDALYLFLVGLTAFFTILISTLFVLFMVKYRRRDPNTIGARIHGGMILEVTWSIVPLFIVMPSSSGPLSCSLRSRVRPPRR